MKINKTLSVAILSGKGGVGKTNIALNLGYCLFRGGSRVLLMDCDLGLANLDVLLGLAPDKTLQDIVDQGIDPKEVTVSIDQGGFDFLPAASGAPELVEMDEETRAILFERLFPVLDNYEFLFMDLGAGINPSVLSFAAMSRLRIVVITPEPTSLTDSYALIKILKTQYGIRDFHVAVNMAESKEEEKQTFGRLNMACKKFLDLEVKYLGAIRQDKTMAEAVRKQIPLMKLAPKSSAGQDTVSYTHLRAHET